MKEEKNSGNRGGKCNSEGNKRKRKKICRKQE